jgi:hypothetical protein
VFRGALGRIALVPNVDSGGAVDSDDRGGAVPTLQEKLRVLGLRLAVKVDDVARTESKGARLRPGPSQLCSPELYVDV